MATTLAYQFVSAMPCTESEMLAIRWEISRRSPDWDAVKVHADTLQQLVNMINEAVQQGKAGGRTKPT